MTDFNLLPMEYRKRSLSVRNVILTTLSILFFATILIFAFWLPIQKKNIAYQKLTMLKEKTVDGSGFDEALLLEQTNVEELEERIISFRKINEGTPGYWKEIFETLYKCMPYKTSLDQISCDNDVIILSGTSIDDKTSAKYLRSLKETGYFGEVRMLKVIYQQDGKVHFTIQCNLSFKTETDMMKGEI
jgi:Tfp pilus assembly protein PilN